jgi:aerobic carbon-monoxide dehydrogenase small subunit
VLGPVGSGHARSGDGSSAAVATPIVHEQTTVAAGPIADFTPAATIEQSFEVAHPPEKVFTLFGDIGAVASCLPGVSLTDTSDPQHITGEISIRLGPIAARFAGVARVERDPATLSGRIVGAGNDKRSRSTTQGEIRYHLAPRADGAATRVDLAIGYTLTGMLAQVGRSGIVRDLARRLTAEFAANLDRRLSGVAPAATEATRLDGMSLLIAALRARLPRWLGGG